MRQLPGLLLLVLVLAACSPGSTTPSPSAPPSPTPGGVLPEEVAGGWQLIQLGDEAIDAIAIPTLDITETGAASGTGGCNQYSGTVMVSPTEIRVGPLMATKIGCDGPINRLETRFLAALQEARAWTIDTEGLLVLEGGERLVFQPRV